MFHRSDKKELPCVVRSLCRYLALIVFIQTGQSWGQAKTALELLPNCTDVIITYSGNQANGSVIDAARSDLSMKCPCLINVDTQSFQHCNEGRTPQWYQFEEGTFKDQLKELDEHLAPPGRDLSRLLPDILNLLAIKAERILVFRESDLIELLLIKNARIIQGALIQTHSVEYYPFSTRKPIDDLRREISAAWDLREKPISCKVLRLETASDQPILVDIPLRTNVIPLPINKEKSNKKPDTRCFTKQDFLERDGVIQISTESSWSRESHKLRWSDSAPVIAIGSSYKNDYRWWALPLIGGAAMVAGYAPALYYHGKAIIEPGYLQAGRYDTIHWAAPGVSVGASMLLAGGLMLIIQPAHFSARWKQATK